MSIEAMKQALELLAVATFHSPELQAKRTEVIERGLQAIAESTDLDAICQDLQEKTYTQAMRIAELEAKLSEVEKHEPVEYIKDVIEGLYENGDPVSVEAAELIDKLYTHPQPKREWVGLTDDQKLFLEIQGGKSDVMLAELVEQWLKEKNT